MKNPIKLPTAASCGVFRFNNYIWENKTTTLKVDISISNITNILFILEWEDDYPYTSGYMGNPASDTISLTISEPNGTLVTFIPSNSNESDNGTIYIRANLNLIPENQSKEASNEIEINQYFSRTNGNWTIMVKVIDAPGGDITCFPNEKDHGNDWTLRIYINYFEGKISEIQN